MIFMYSLFLKIYKPWDISGWSYLKGYRFNGSSTSLQICGCGFDILYIKVNVIDSVHLVSWCNNEMLLSSPVPNTTMKEQTTTLTNRAILKKIRTTTGYTSYLCSTFANA